MKITERFLTKGSQHGRTGQSLTPKGICVHYVGNPGSTAENNRRWFENGAGGAGTSAHYIIGLEGEILLLIPENERAMHAGKSYGKAWDETAKTNNAYYIGIECCHPSASGEFNALTYQSLIWLCGEICKRYGFDPEKQVVRHYDITGKSCPLFYRNNETAWVTLKNDIKNETSANTVRVCLDGETCFPEAENIGGSWFVGVNGLDGVRLKLGDVLNLAGYRVSWDAGTATVMGVKK